ncbi:MAG TPA: hypothetical protein VGH84_08680 [Steroidobacteraceae bacterium]
MAKIKATMLRKLHTQMGAILDEFETNCAAEKAAGGQDNDPNGQAGAQTRVAAGGADDTPDNTPQVGGNDSASRGVPMREAFKHFGRIKQL